MYVLVETQNLDVILFLPTLSTTYHLLQALDLRLLASFFATGQGGAQYTDLCGIQWCGVEWAGRNSDRLDSINIEEMGGGIWCAIISKMYVSGKWQQRETEHSAVAGQIPEIYRQMGGG